MAAAVQVNTGAIKSEPDLRARSVQPAEPPPHQDKYQPSSAFQTYQQVDRSAAFLHALQTMVGSMNGGRSAGPPVPAFKPPTLKSRPAPEAQSPAGSPHGPQRSDSGGARSSDGGDDVRGDNAPPIFVNSAKVAGLQLPISCNDVKGTAFLERQVVACHCQACSDRVAMGHDRPLYRCVGTAVHFFFPFLFFTGMYYSFCNFPVLIVEFFPFFVGLI
jgi:hypothetical protein